MALWWSERRTTAEFNGLAHPDGFGQWTAHGAALYFFLEHDMVSEPLRQLTDKLSGHANLATSGGPRGTVLFTLPTSDREANLHRRPAAYPPPVPVATTTMTDLVNPVVVPRTRPGLSPVIVTGGGWQTSSGRPGPRSVPIGDAPSRKPAHKPGG